jgi:hypothetical protein
MPGTSSLGYSRPIILFQRSLAPNRWVSLATKVVSVSLLTAAEFLQGLIETFNPFLHFGQFDLLVLKLT